MSSESSDRELFIVDNSISRWTGLGYLEEWTDIAKSFDIATGYFDIGSRLARDGRWQQLEKIRIQMGAEISIEGEHPAPLEIDGDYVGEGSLSARVLPGALDLLLPGR